jgi:glycosyltransferase involved in cell wall biosynthesis
VKVLHLNNHYARVGGVETILFNALDALEEQGVVNVVVHEYPGSTVRSARRAYEVPGCFEPRVTGRVLGTLRGVFEEESPDVIHIHGAGSGEILRLGRLHAPVVQGVYNHSFYCPGAARYLPVLDTVCERAFGRGCIVSAFLTHCNSVRPRALLDSYHRCRDMLDAHHGVRFLALSTYQARCMAQSGYERQSVSVLAPFTPLPLLSEPDRGEAVLFVGRLVKQKGLDRLIRAAAQSASPWKLIVAGDGPERAANERLAGRLGTADRVEFRGWLDGADLRAAYEDARVVVMPSVWPEPFGMVGIEAMSFSKPVVAFDVGGTRDWLEDGVTGLVATPGDVVDLRRRVEALLTDPGLARKMGERGRERVERDFTKAVYVARLRAVYGDAVECRRRQLAEPSGRHA